MEPSSQWSRRNFKSLLLGFWDVRSVHPSGLVGWAVRAGREDGGTPAHLYPERGGVYFNIPGASRQRALIINKLGTRHGVPQGDQPEQ